MKAFKIYGDNVYINGEKKPFYEVENGISFNGRDFGYGVDSYLIVIENEDEREIVDASGIKTFGEREVPYAVYKALQNVPGCGYIKKGTYNAEQKTIAISAVVD